MNVPKSTRVVVSAAFFGRDAACGGQRLLWRLWAFFSGIPVGAAIALAALREPAPLQLVWGALAGGVTLALLVSLLVRGRDDAFERGRHLAAATSFGWAAVPAAVAVYFAWSPGPWVYVGFVVVLLAAALFVATRALGPAAGLLRWKLRAVASLLIASLAVLTVAAAGAAIFATAPEPSSRFSSVLDAIDAEVVTRPVPACSAEPRAVAVLMERGAHPVLSPDGAQLWFDAESTADGGRRQIHRLDRATGSVTCWSCGDLGNNVHPSISPSGVSLVFQSDRHATWRHPDDTDLYLAAAQRAENPDHGQRLSFTVGPDESPVFGPGPMMVTWSRRLAGRYDVVAASIRSGHGGLLLGTPGVVASGGAEWIAPVAWSPDGRSLLVARGNPFAPLALEAVDPNTFSRRLLATDAARAGSFDGDGGWLGFATTRPLQWAGVLPRALGFALAPLAIDRRVREPLYRDTSVRSAASEQPANAAAIALPADIASWGEPTGLAIEPDGSGFVLGQRRQHDDGVQERLVAIELACTQTAIAPRAPAAP